MAFSISEKLKEFIANYRVWDQADTDIARDLEELVDEAESSSEEYERLEKLVMDHRLYELHSITPEKHNATEQVEIALALLSGIRKAEDAHMLVALFEDEDALTELAKVHTRYDELEKFRSLIIGAVVKAGALAAGSKIEDNRLVILVQSLFP